MAPARRLGLAVALVFTTLVFAACSDDSSRGAPTANGHHSVWLPDGTKIAFPALIPGTENRGIAIFGVPPLGRD